MASQLKLLLVLLVTLAVTSKADVGDFQVSVKVIDESGKPMPGVNVSASYVRSTSLIPAANNISEKQVNFTTDKDGQVVIKDSGVCNNYVYCGVKPVKGYYPDATKEFRFQNVKSGNWQPWNPTIEFILKPVGVQVPMFAKKIEWDTSVPEINKPIGYDLEIGDWVAPFGKGKTSDFLFTLERKFTSVTQDFSATLTLAFQDGGDGIILIAPERPA